MHITQSKFDNFAIFEKHIVRLAIILVVEFGYYFYKKLYKNA